MQKLHMLIIVGVALNITSCANVRHAINRQVTIDGPEPLIAYSNATSQIDLIQELVPRDKMGSLNGCTTLNPADELEDATARSCMAQALALFYSSPLDLEGRRNRI